MSEWENGAGFEHPKCRLIGLEIEYNETGSFSELRRTLEKWRSGHHSDGSCGYEVVTAPIAGPHVAACVTDVCNAFDRADTKADERCGVHVHVDARDLMWADMFRLLWVYARVEPLLYVLAGQHRIENQYCKPSGRDYLDAMGYVDRKGGVLATAYNQTPYDDGSKKKTSKADAGRSYVRSTKPGKKDGGRYKGLNILPWLAGRRKNARPRVIAWKQDEHGNRIRTSGGKMIPTRFEPAPAKPIKGDTTIEFRLHRNTLDAGRIIGWAQVCERIVSWCATHTDKEAQALPRSALRCMAVIAPESMPFVLSRIRSWRRATRKGLLSPVSRRIVCTAGRWRIKKEGVK